MTDDSKQNVHYVSCWPDNCCCILSDAETWYWLSKNDASCTTATHSCGKRSGNYSRASSKTRRHLELQTDSKITHHRRHHQRRRCNCVPPLATRTRLMHFVGNGVSSSSAATYGPTHAVLEVTTWSDAAAFRLALHVGRETCDVPDCRSSDYTTHSSSRLEVPVASIWH